MSVKLVSLCKGALYCGHSEKIAIRLKRNAQTPSRGMKKHSGNARYGYSLLKTNSKWFYIKLKRKVENPPQMLSLIYASERTWSQFLPWLI